MMTPDNVDDLNLEDAQKDRVNEVYERDFTMPAVPKPWPGRSCPASKPVQAGPRGATRVDGELHLDHWQGPNIRNIDPAI